MAKIIGDSQTQNFVTTFSDGVEITDRGLLGNINSVNYFNSYIMSYTSTTSGTFPFTSFATSGTKAYLAGGQTATASLGYVYGVFSATIPFVSTSNGPFISASLQDFTIINTLPEQAGGITGRSLSEKILIDNQGAIYVAGFASATLALGAFKNDAGGAYPVYIRKSHITASQTWTTIASQSAGNVNQGTGVSRFKEMICDVDGKIYYAFFTGSSADILNVFRSVDSGSTWNGVYSSGGFNSKGVVAGVTTLCMTNSGSAIFITMGKEGGAVQIYRSVDGSSGSFAEVYHNSDTTGNGTNEHAGDICVDSTGFMVAAFSIKHNIAPVHFKNFILTSSNGGTTWGIKTQYTGTRGERPYTIKTDRNNNFYVYSSNQSDYLDVQTFRSSSTVSTFFFITGSTNFPNTATVYNNGLNNNKFYVLSDGTERNALPRNFYLIGANFIYNWTNTLADAAQNQHTFQKFSQASFVKTKNRPKKVINYSANQTEYDIIDPRSGINFKNQFTKNTVQQTNAIGDIKSNFDSTKSQDFYNGTAKFLRAKAVFSPPTETLVYTTGAIGTLSGRWVMSDIKLDSSGTLYACGYAQLSGTTAVVTSSYVEGVPNSAFIVKSTNGTTWTTVDSSGAIWNSIYIDKNDNLYAVGTANNHFWTVRRSLDRGTTWTTIDNYASSFTGSAYAAFVDQSGVLYVGGTVASSSTGPRRVWLIRSASFSGSGQFADIDVHSGSGENICYSIRKSENATKYELYAAGVINVSGALKISSGSSTFQLGSTGSWGRQFSTASVIFTDMSIDDLDVFGKNANIENPVYLSAEVSLNANSYVWRVYNFSASMGAFQLLDQAPSSSVEVSTPSMLARDNDNNYLYCVGGVVHKTSSFREPNCWSIRVARMIASSGAQCSYVTSGSFSYVVSKPMNDYINNSLYSDYVLPFGCIVRSGSLYVCGVVSGNLAAGVANATGSTINTAVIYKYTYNPLNSLQIPLSNSRGIRTVYEFYPNFFDENNVPLNISSSMILKNGTFIYLDNLLSGNFRNAEKNNFKFNLSVVSSSFIPENFNNNIAINFRDNVNVLTSSYGYNSNVNELVNSSSFNDLKQIGVFLSGATSASLFMTQFMSGGLFANPFIDLYSTNLSMISISSSFTGNFSLENIVLYFKIPLTSQGVSYYRTINSDNNNKVLEDIKPKISVRIV